MRKPIVVLWSDLGQPFYATQHYKQLKNGTLLITGGPLGRRKNLRSKGTMARKSKTTIEAPPENELSGTESKPVKSIMWICPKGHREVGSDTWEDPPCRNCNYTRNMKQAPATFTEEERR
jgi:hypothetical protein